MSSSISERPDAGVADAHRDARIGHVRHQVDRQPEQRDPPSSTITARDHEHRDGTFDRDAGNATLILRDSEKAQPDQAPGSRHSALVCSN